jgi:hypothetical protein
MGTQVCKATNVSSHTSHDKQLIEQDDPLGGISHFRGKYHRMPEMAQRTVKAGLPSFVQFVDRLLLDRSHCTHDPPFTR